MGWWDLPLLMAASYCVGTVVGSIAGYLRGYRIGREDALRQVASW